MSRMLWLIATALIIILPSLDTCLAVSIVFHKLETPLQGESLLETAEPADYDIESGADENLSFIQSAKLEKLKEVYKVLKKEFKKNHSKEEFLLLKYHAMNIALKKANEKTGSS